MADKKLDSKDFLLHLTEIKEERQALNIDNKTRL